MVYVLGERLVSSWCRVRIFLNHENIKRNRVCVLPSRMQKLTILPDAIHFLVQLNLRSFFIPEDFWLSNENAYKRKQLDRAMQPITWQKYKVAWFYLPCGEYILKFIGTEEMPLFTPVTLSVSISISWRTSSKSVNFLPLQCRNSAYSVKNINSNSVFHRLIDLDTHFQAPSILQMHMYKSMLSWVSGKHYIWAHAIDVIVQMKTSLQQERVS